MPAVSPSQPMSNIPSTTSPAPIRCDRLSRSCNATAAIAVLRMVTPAGRDHPTMCEWRKGIAAGLQQSKHRATGQQQDRAASPTDAGQVRDAQMQQHGQQHQARDQIAHHDQVGRRHATQYSSLVPRQRRSEPPVPARSLPGTQPLHRTEAARPRSGGVAGRLERAQGVQYCLGIQPVAVIGVHAGQHDAAIGSDDIGRRHRQAPCAIAIDHRQFVAEVPVTAPAIPAAVRRRCQSAPPRADRHRSGPEMSARSSPRSTATDPASAATRRPGSRQAR